MQDLIDKALLILWSVWRFRWTMLVVTWVVAVCGWVFVASLDYRYQASARIFVDSNRLLAPLLRDITVQPDVNERVALMSRALLTRPNLEQLIRMTDMDHGVVDDREYEELIDELRRSILIRSNSRERSMYLVGFEHEDPVMAKRALQSVISIFIESNLGDRREDSQSAQTFLDDQIADYELQLEDAESRLSSFRRANSGVMPNEAGGYYARLESAVTELRTARQELRESRNRRDTLREELQAELSTDSIAAVVSQRQDRINRLQDELDELLVRYTERHPRVAQLREMMDGLLSQPPEEADPEAPQAGQQSRLQDSIVYQNIRTLLTESEARVAELEARVSDFEEQVSELRETIDSIPLVEAQLQQLDRDYETIRSQHALLLERRESARLSKRLEQDVDDVKFRIIDPPFVPSKPSSPNKLLLNAAVMLAALGAGIGLAVLLSLLRPVYFSQAELSKKCETLVLGSISLFQTPADRFRQRLGLTGYAVMSCALLGIFAVVMVLQITGIDIQTLLQREEFRQLQGLVQIDGLQSLIGPELLETLAQLLGRTS